MPALVVIFNSVVNMTFYPISHQLAGAHASLTKLFADKTHSSSVFRDPKKSEVESMDWNSNGEKLMVCCRDGNLKLWRSDRLMEERVWAGGSWTWTECHPTDPNIVSAVSWDGKVKMADLRVNASSAPADLDLKKSKGMEKFLSSSFSVDGSLLAVVTRTDLIHIIQNGEVVLSSIQPGCEVYSVIFDSSNRLWVATGGTPGRILIFNLDGSLVSEFAAHSHVVSCLNRTRASPSRIVSGGSDALVALWDAKNNFACVRTFPHSVSPVTSVSTNFDNSLVVWGSGAIGAKDGEAIISIAGLETASHYASIPVSAPVSRIKWHPTKQALAFAMQQGPGVDTNVQLFSFSD